MSAKNFASYGDLETILTGFANAIKSKPGTLYADNPIGSIVPYGGATAPNGWFLCQGQAISRTTYADLFAAIGTSFGAGDGSTTFNLPDLRGEFIRGAGTNSHTNQGNGGSVGTHQDATAVPTISARYNGSNIIAEISSPKDETGAIRSNILYPDTEYNKTSNTVYATFSAMAGDTPGYQECTVRPTNTSVNYIIKAEHTPVPADFMDAVDEAVEEAAVDTVAVGNMKPVTSNAVAKVINRTNELVWNTEYVDLGSWTSGGLLEKCGFIIINKIVTLKANCPSGALLCTGFPAPIVGMEIPISFDNEEMSGGLFLDVYGELRAWITPNENDENIRINLIYITTD